MQTSESIKEIAGALCEFQGKVGTIKKSETNPFFKSKYADLSTILDAIQLPLIECGLSFVQFPSGENGLETMLMHKSGEWMREVYYMNPTKKPIKQYDSYDSQGKGIGSYKIVAYESDPQGAGSVITYQRRYALGAILGLNIDEDDDGNAGSNPEPKKQDKEPKRTAHKWSHDELNLMSLEGFKEIKNGEKDGRKWYLVEFQDKQGFIDERTYELLTKKV